MKNLKLHENLEECKKLLNQFNSIKFNLDQCDRDSLQERISRSREAYTAKNGLVALMGGIIEKLNDSIYYDTLVPVSSLQVSDIVTINCQFYEVVRVFDNGSVSAIRITSDYKRTQTLIFLVDGDSEESHVTLVSRYEAEHNEFLIKRGSVVSNVDAELTWSLLPQEVKEHIFAKQCKNPKFWDLYSIDDWFEQQVYGEDILIDYIQNYGNL